MTMENRAELLWLHVKSCVLDAMNNKSRLRPGALAVQGFSGAMTRHFYNNVVRFPSSVGLKNKVTYLEVGTYAGSTLISALQGNEDKVSAVAIDNWSQFNGPRDVFWKNMAEHTSATRDIMMFDRDCFQVAAAEVRSAADVYLYDGAHDKESHRRGITHFADFLSDVSIVIVDDWNWKDVRDGTAQGFEEVKDRLKVYGRLEIRHTMDNQHTSQPLASRMFHNGMAVFVVVRTDAALEERSTLLTLTDRAAAPMMSVLL